LGGKCLALFEAGQPHCLDPDSLETLGVDLLGGNISAGAPFSTGWKWIDRCAG
jgi:all-trans-8'-apo-beta-carotenal 15,15'-oxygenase